MRRLLILVLLQLACFATPAGAAEDMTPRIVVMSAFKPELTALEAATTDKRRATYASTVFTIGMLEGKPVALLLSGVSMVNAAMNTQLALDHFNVRAIVFSGIAGGVDPNLDVGDVVVADRWAQYLETQLARETSPGQFAAPNDVMDEIAQEIPPMGMMYATQRGDVPGREGRTEVVVRGRPRPVGGGAQGLGRGDAEALYRRAVSGEGA